jgi:single-stranded DNA-binding protein
VYVEGHLQVREYEDKDGNARTSVEVVASKVRFLGRGNNHGEEKRPVPVQPKAKGGQPSAPADDFNQSGDDVPF